MMLEWKTNQHQEVDTAEPNEANSKDRGEEE